jgi:hypothetical protein
LVIFSPDPQKKKKKKKKKGNGKKKEEKHGRELSFGAVGCRWNIYAYFYIYIYINVNMNMNVNNCVYQSIYPQLAYLYTHALPKKKGKGKRQKKEHPQTKPNQTQDLNPNLLLWK